MTARAHQPLTEPGVAGEGRVSTVADRRPSIFAILAEFVGRHPRPFAALVGLLAVDALVTSVAVLTLVPLADYLLDPSLRAASGPTRAIVGGLTAVGITPGFWSLGLPFVGANVLKGLLSVATRYSILRIKYAVVRRLFGDALDTFLRARWEFFGSADHGRLLNTFNREMNTIGDTIGHLATQLATLLQLAIYLIVPLWLSPTMTLIALGLAIALGAPLLLLQKVAYRLGQRNTATANTMMGVLTETLAAARIILGFGRQAQSRQRFLTAFDQHIGVTLRSQTVEASANALFQPIATLAGLVAVGVALSQGMPLPETAALLWSLLRAFPLLGQLLSSNVSINNFLPSYQQLLALRASAERVREVEGVRAFGGLQSGVRLEGVSFTYPGRRETLREIDIDIRKGATTALVGASGSGKSTIVDLVLGFQLPHTGRVLVDGVPLSELRQNAFRQRVGYVPQDPILFHASIRENLLWSAPEASDAELWKACRMGSADAFIAALPDGLDTVVGDRGTRLSGGQRQRVALARALIRRPELLILDEATSSLDSESERLIEEAIDSLAGDMTILIIAHRLSTIASADHVYVLSDGRVAEHGTFAELCSHPDGVLARMVAFQVAGGPAADLTAGVRIS